MGNAYAVQNVGSMYANGLFVKRDQAKALERFEKAIEAGNAGALAAAGVVYFNGDGNRPITRSPRNISSRRRISKFLAIMYEHGARSGRSRKGRRSPGSSRSRA
jgi:hypothetical protein